MKEAVSTPEERSSIYSRGKKQYLLQNNHY